VQNWRIPKNLFSMLEGEELILQLKAFNMENSSIDELANIFELLTEMETPEIIDATAVLHGIRLLLNLATFLEFHITLKMKIRAAFIVN
jgi:hypothetical protein